jgi:hypothetical protein
MQYEENGAVVEIAVNKILNTHFLNRILSPFKKGVFLGK